MDTQFASAQINHNGLRVRRLTDPQGWSEVPVRTKRAVGAGIVNTEIARDRLMGRLNDRNEANPPRRLLRSIGAVARV